MISRKTLCSMPQQVPELELIRRDPGFRAPEILGERPSEFALHMTDHWLTTYESLPEIDFEGQHAGSEVATCDTLPELELPAKSVSCHEDTKETFETVEEGSNEDDSSCGQSIVSADRDITPGLSGSISWQGSWGRAAVNHFGYEVDEVLKLGHFGAVRLMREKCSGNIVVAKLTVTTTTVDRRPLGRREYELLQSLRHDHIISPSFFLETKFETYMFLEWYANGSLWGYVSSRGQGLQLAEVQSIGQQLIDAVDYLHVARIVHCAVQPANILLDSGGWVLLTGFGSARWMDRNVGIRSPELTGDEFAKAAMHDLEVAPELADGLWATPRTDVWGFGLCCLFMLSGQTSPDGNPAASHATSTAFLRRWNTASARHFLDTNPSGRDPDARCLYSVSAWSVNSNPLWRPSVADIDCCI